MQVLLLGVALLVTFLAFICLVDAGSKKRSSYPLWDNLNIKKELRSEAYVFKLNEDKKPTFAKGKKTEEKGKDYSLEFIQDIYDIIYAKQNPSKEQCRSQRFSVLQMSATSFEGTGSLLKQVMISTAIALHSNRTLIWGLGLPFPFEVTRELWNGPGNDDILINEEHLNCSQHDITFGPLGCFFQPISTCTLEDAGPMEVIEFSHNPYNDSARLSMSEMRRGVAMYHPPLGLMDYIWSKGKYPDSVKTELIQNQAYLWSAAVAAYVFRVKPALIASFERRYNHLFENTNSVWGMHIRHGDLKALANIYSYKEIFDFDDYFGAVLKLSHKQKFTPEKLFIATDSTEADQIQKIYEKFMKNHLQELKKSKDKTCKAGGKCKKALEDEEEDEDAELVRELLREQRRAERDDDEDYDEDEDEEDEEDEDEDEDEDEEDDEDEEEEAEEDQRSAIDSLWFGGKAPKIMTIGNSQRYRTEHGSHTVAANGGCFRDENYAQKGMRCALNYEAIIHYQAFEEHRSVPRPNRMLRVYLESIEDLYLLSRTSSLVAQGSSHYSTLAALLQVAAHGTKNIANRIDYLDQKTITSGITPTAYLHGMNMLNGTNAIDSTKLKSGAQRWILHTNHFISGLPNQQSMNKIKLTFDPWSSDNRIHIENGLPHISDQLFYLEARTWLGSPKYKPSIPGHCPGPLKKDQNPLQYIAEVINLGVEHLQSSHNTQAMQCWSDALNVIAQFPQISSPQHLEEMKSVANGNMQTMRIYRYSEMIVNELRTIKNYYIFTDKYMKLAYDRGIDESTKAASDNKPLSLEDVNEKVLKLEKELKQLKELREKLLVAHEHYINNGYNIDGIDKGRALPR